MMRFLTNLIVISALVACCWACRRENPETRRNCAWRDAGAVTPAKNQGQCAACWAFAVNAAVESYYFRQSGEFGDLQTLSEQHLIDCGHTFDRIELGRCFEESGPVCGGNPFNALLVIRNNMYDLYNNATYPWHADSSSSQEVERGQCASHPGQPKFPTRLFTPTKTRKLIDNEDIMNLILEHGPVVATIHFPEDWNNPRQPRIYTKACTGDLDHAVAIIGYGEEKGQSFWLLKNSHGENWADRGFIRLAMKPRGDNTDCNIKKNIVYLK